MGRKLKVKQIIYKTIFSMLSIGAFLYNPQSVFVIWL